jgi:chemotaxis protein MotA
LDLASIFGLIGGIAALVITIFVSGDLAGYVDIPSIICTFGGTAAITVMAFPFKKLKEGFKALKYVFVYN